MLRISLQFKVRGQRNPSATEHAMSRPSYISIPTVEELTAKVKRTNNGYIWNPTGPEEQTAHENQNVFVLSCGKISLKK